MTDPHTPPTPVDERVERIRAYLKVNLVWDENDSDMDYLVKELDAANDAAESRARINEQLITERKELIEANAILRGERDALRATIEIVVHCFETENDPADACNKAIAILSKATSAT